MQTTITIHVHGPGATAIRFVPSADSFRAPLAAGFVFGQLQVDPAGWTGDIGVTGADAALVGLDSHMQVVALAALPDARDYVITVTAAE